MQTVWRRIASVAAAIILLSTALASPVSAHGPCHPGRSSGDLEFARTRRTASSGNVYNRVLYTDSSSGNGITHVAENWDKVRMLMTEPGVGQIESWRSAGAADGKWDGFGFKLTIGGDVKVNWTTSVTENADIVVDIRYYTTSPFTARYDFYMNGILRDWWAGTPYFSPTMIEFRGEVKNRASQFLGRASDMYTLHGVYYERNGNLLEWGGGSTWENATFTEISDPGGTAIYFYDSTC